MLAGLRFEPEGHTSTIWFGLEARSHCQNFTTQIGLPVTRSKRQLYGARRESQSLRSTTS